MIEYYAMLKNNEIVQKINSFKVGAWVKVTNPTDEEIEILVKKYDLDKENILNGLDIYETPRFELEDNMAYIYLATPTDKIKHEHVSSFLVVYTKSALITISKNNLEIFDKILSQKRTYKMFSPSRNLLRILFYISRLLEGSVRGIMKEIKANKGDLSRLKNENIARLIVYEDKLNHYISSFGGAISNYQRILRHKTFKFPKKDQELIEDLIIDLNETLNLSKQTLKTITNMRDYYSTKLSNDLNKTVTFLTAFTVFLSIPTLISGVYGMNVLLPMQSSPNIMFLLGGLILGIWGTMFLILKLAKLI